MQISIGNLGAVIGTQLYRANDTPLFVLGHSFALGYMAANVLVTGTLWWYLERQNRKKDRLLAEQRARGEVAQKEGWEGDVELTWKFST